MAQFVAVCYHNNRLVEFCHSVAQNFNVRHQIRNMFSGRNNLSAVVRGQKRVNDRKIGNIPLLLLLFAGVSHIGRYGGEVFSLSLILFAGGCSLHGLFINFLKSSFFFFYPDRIIAGSNKHRFGFDVFRVLNNR